MNLVEKLEPLGTKLTLVYAPGPTFDGAFASSFSCSSNRPYPEPKQAFLSAPPVTSITLLEVLSKYLLFPLARLKFALSRMEDPVAVFRLALEGE